MRASAPVETKASGMDNTRYKILLIEDDKLDQMAFKRLVEDEKLPYDYTIAGSVSEAQSILASEQFDAVIADYELGDGTAFDVLDSVKNTPIIFVTGTGNEEVAVKSWKAGAYDYLTKDADRNYLKAVPITVENAIEHKRLKEILNQKQKNLEAIFDAVPIGMLLVDENMIIKRVNDAIRQIVGREYLQIINQQVGNAGLHQQHLQPEGMWIQPGLCGMSASKGHKKRAGFWTTCSRAQNPAYA